MKLIEKIQRHGIAGSAKKALIKLKSKSGYTKWQFRHAPVYANPTPSELAQIEQGLLTLGIELHDYAPPPQNSTPFGRKAGFHRTITAV